MYPKISIIFPTFNNWGVTHKYLKSLKNIEYPKDRIEVIVVNNNSQDRTAENILKKFPRVKLLPQRSNLGFSKAINIAAKSAKNEYLFITNNDVSYKVGFFKELVGFRLKDDTIGVCGGKIITKTELKTFDDGAANISWFNSRLLRLKNYNKTQVVDYISGAGMLVKKNLFNKVGGFDNNFPFYFEDLDFCLRIKKLRSKVVYYPKAVMYHNQSSTARNMPQKWLNDVWYEGKIRVIIKHFPFWSKSLVLFLQFLFCFYIFITTGEKRFNSFFRALKISGLKKGSLFYGINNKSLAETRQERSYFLA